MKIITEIELREMYKKEPFDSYSVCYPDKLTPAASQFLSDRRVTVIEAGGNPVIKAASANRREQKKEAIKEPESGYLLMDCGQRVAEKPEEYTHLKGRMLVRKNHSRIKFRGKLDSLQALVVAAVIESDCSGHRALAEDLGKLLEYLRRILRAEVLEEALGPVSFKEWSDQEIRERSHHPDQYFGVKHFMPDPKLGKLMAVLNQIRAQSRELEIAAVEVFCNEEDNKTERQDILLALNRLSSIVYIIMCQYLGGIYKI